MTDKLPKAEKKRFFNPNERTPAPEAPTKSESLFISDEDELEEEEPPAQTIPEVQFKQDLTRKVGEIAPAIIKYLYEKYSMKRDAVMFAMGELLTNPPDIDNLPGATEPPQKRPKQEQEHPPRKRININEYIEELSHAQQQAPKEESWERLIGTMSSLAMATRPTMKPLKYQEPLEIRRIIPKNTTLMKSTAVRIYHNDREIGKFPEELARVLSPLFDLKIASFRASVLADTQSRLRTGDSFWISVEVFLLNEGFVKNIEAIENPADMKSFNASKETEAEAALRLRQSSLANLFDRLGVKPLKIAEDEEEDDDSDGIVELDADETVSELNLDQLQEFYQNNNQLKIMESLPETTTPPEANFKILLRPYQKHGLSWLLAREHEFDVLEMLLNDDKLSTQAREELESLGTVNPLWRKYRWPDYHDDGDSPQPTQVQTDKYFYANMYNGELSLEPPVIKSSLRGGILADEMGLGKTISTLALINSVPYDNASPLPKSKKPYASRTTLIVVPMSLLSQWKSEFDKCNSNGRHFCRVHYGDGQEVDLSRSLCSKDTSAIPIVMLTTYGTILSEFTRLAKKRNAKGELPHVGLYSVKFFRIILDEGHNIRNRITKTAKSVYELELSRRWVLTGTPIVNRLDDLYSLAKFLQIDPWSNFSYWKTFVTLPFEEKKISQSIAVIQSILSPIFLRRTKNQKDRNGKPLVELPSKEVVIEDIKFNDDEEKLYKWFKDRAYHSFAEGMKSGQLLRRYTQILTHILRLRQVCCHVDLIGGAHEMEDDVINAEADEDTRKFLQSMKETHVRYANDTEVKQTMYKLYDKIQEDNECSICTQSPIAYHEMAITPCGHTFCLSCILEHLDFQSELKKEKLCPNCRVPISKYQLFRVRSQPTSANEIRFYTKKESTDRDFQLYLYDPNRSSSKVQALVRHLKTLQLQAPNLKVVVFSQFLSYLDIIETELKMGGDFLVSKFDGRLNMNDRAKLLDAFNKPLTNGKISVLLLSLRAGGVGLNLTTASRAFMMDPWWSPSVEDQAIDRIHRIGQNETVKVVRFIMANSIETKMLKIQDLKKQIGEAVAAEEEERRQRRIEEIQILFEE
ncbi:DNA repair protein RAD5 [Candida viswanathii]|uniref:DNA repair protein RAD5 n=1 Tax=Candida viswanathii TaxID=5486 RepID=A0A367XLZ1_9ASCO|nr:DNA repair protein RAD5 [Candida viswanathii]